MQNSIVPNIESEQTTYLVLDEIGHYGDICREISEGETNEMTIVQWTIEGRFSHPVKVVAFNTDDGWSRNATQEIAAKLLDPIRNVVALGGAAKGL